MSYRYVVAHLRLPQTWAHFNGFEQLGRIVRGDDDYFPNPHIRSFFEWMDVECPDYTLDWHRGPTDVVTYEFLHLLTVTVPDEDAAFLIRMRWGYVGVPEHQKIPWLFPEIDPRSLLRWDWERI